MSLPRTFTDLDKAYNAMPNSFLNIAGVVVDLMPVTRTAKGQFMLTFKMLDAKLRDAIYGTEGLKTRFFMERQEDLPSIEKLGDIVILKNVKMFSFQGEIVAISNYQTEVLIIPADEIPTRNHEVGKQDKARIKPRGSTSAVKKFSVEEQSYVAELSHEMSDIVRYHVSNMKTPVARVPASIPTEPAAMRNAFSVDLPASAPQAPAAIREPPETNIMLPDPKRRRFGPKFKFIKELAHRDFADLMVQVVKKFPTQSGDTELYVTDYTENKEMFLYTAPEEEDDREREGDTFGYTGAPKRSWPGPYGQLVLKVELRQPHAGYANDHVEEGDFVLMRNVRIKVYHHLEGNMWPDQANPQQVKIWVNKEMKKPEIVEILERKEKYWATRTAKLGRAAQQEPAKKKPTKTEKKKLRKQREAEQAAAAANGAMSKMVDSMSKAQHGTINGGPKVDINPHVQCANEDVPIRSIREIVDPRGEKHSYNTPDGETLVLPFINVKSRARVRVVDFEPKPLEQFSVLQTPARDDDFEDMPMTDYESSPQYEWFFSLLLEDASKSKAATLGSEDRMWVNVHHSDAQYLLGNSVDDPVDLHHDRRLLARLKDKLFVLWGDLEEKTGEQAISNKPFECCLSEYGVEIDENDPDRSSHPFGWMRMYSLSGVTIR